MRVRRRAPGARVANTSRAPSSARNEPARVDNPRAPQAKIFEFREENWQFFELYCTCSTVRLAARLTQLKAGYPEVRLLSDRPAAKATVALGTSCGHIERRARVRNAPRAPIERAAAARPAGVGGSFRNEDANSGLLLLGSTAPPQGPRVMWLLLPVGRVVGRKSPFGYEVGPQVLQAKPLTS